MPFSTAVCSIYRNNKKAAYKRHYTDHIQDMCNSGSPRRFPALFRNVVCNNISRIRIAWEFSCLTALDNIC